MRSSHGSWLDSTLTLGVRFFWGGGGDLCLSAEKDGQLRAWAWLGMENAMHRLAKGGSVSCIGLAKVELGDGAQAWRGGCKSRTAY